MSAPMAASRPEAAHLTPDVMATLRASLLAELDVQRAQLADHQATIDELTAQPALDSLGEREVAESGSLRAAEAIADIEHALHRMDDGTYGTCERCDGAIALERLEAIPHTRHCIGCPAPAPRLLG